MAERQNYTFPKCPLREKLSHNGKTENSNTVSNMFSCQCADLSAFLPAEGGLIMSTGGKYTLASMAKCWFWTMAVL